MKIDQIFLILWKTGMKIEIIQNGVIYLLLTKIMKIQYEIKWACFCTIQSCTNHVRNWHVQYTILHKVGNVCSGTKLQGASQVTGGKGPGGSAVAVVPKFESNEQ